MELYNDDCLKILPTLAESYIDMVLVDLPYGQTGCEWDNVIDLEKMWKQLNRICKDTTAIVFFCTTKFGNTLINSNPKQFRYDLVWEKSNSVGFLNANKMPLRLHEMMYIFYKKLPTYNPQKTAGKPYNTNGNKPSKLFGDKPSTSTDNPTGDRHPTSIVKTYGAGGIIKHQSDGSNRHPTSIIQCPNKKSKHPTAKPVELCEWLVKSYSNEGDTILDFTMGSGSTGVACKNLNRKFIGIEMDEAYFKICEERLK
jgi:DNA modification methylase